MEDGEPPTTSSSFFRPSVSHSLTQCFLPPARQVEGKLVTDSFDLYLVLEYTDGGDLFHTSEQLNSSEVRSIMGQLLLASQFLHSCGVIHRDIKSANILIKTNQETGEKTVKLADFGCARVASTNGDGAKGMTRSRSHDSLPEQKSPEGSADLRRAQMTTAVATPCYRAPEVVMSLESYTSKVDIWSLGCILAELLARVLSHSKGERPAGHLDPSIHEHEL